MTMGDQSGRRKSPIGTKANEATEPDKHIFSNFKRRLFLCFFYYYHHLFSTLVIIVVQRLVMLLLFCIVKTQKERTPFCFYQILFLRLLTQP